MSNSLTINTPNIVQQNTPLRNVPSGSTATPDYSVKYVPQDLTEAQQAQARQNIGAISESEIPASAQANWNETDTESPAYIQNKPTIPAAQVQADWNQSDTTAVDYIKNKPNIGEPRYDDFDNMMNTMIVYFPQTRQIGTELGEVIGASIIKGVYTKYDSAVSLLSDCIGKTTLIFNGNSLGRLSIQKAFQDKAFDWIWVYASGVSKLDSGVCTYQPVTSAWINDVNIVYRGFSWDSENINAVTDNQIQKLTVWDVNNSTWNNIWAGTGNVVLFDNNLDNFVEQSAPTSLIPFTLYMPKSRYTEFVTAMTTAWSQSVVENYILPKVEQYDFIYSEGFKYKMITLPTLPLTMTDANNNTISGDFVAQNITIS